MPAISVIIVNWNGKDYLPTCLRSLQSQTLQDFEVILIDNGSSDGSVEWVQTHFPWVHVVTLPCNQGFCGANNRGIAEARGKYVVLLNNDTEADGKFLQSLFESIEAHPEAGFCATRMIRFHNRSQIDSCGIGLLPLGKGYAISAGRENQVSLGQERLVFGACAGAALYRRSMLDQIGGFDEDFFSHVEDTDLSWRAQLAGYCCIYVPGAIVYHIGGATSRQVRDDVLFRIQRNKTWAYLKNMPLALLIFSLPFHILYSFYWLLRAAQNGQGLIVLRALAEVIRNRPHIMKKRQQIQKDRRLSSVALLQLMDWHQI